LEEASPYRFYGRFDASGDLVGLFRATLEEETVVKGELLDREGWTFSLDLLRNLTITGNTIAMDEVSPDQALAYMVKLGQASGDTRPGTHGSQPWRALFDEGEAPDIPGSCPRCGWARVVPIIWGYPDPTVIEFAQHGEVALGGCLLPEREEQWMCQVCGLTGGEIREH
jgi:hypothetical protein